jgi:hypothetical protein
MRRTGTILLVGLVAASFTAGCNMVGGTRQNEGELVLTLSFNADEYAAEAPIQAFLQLQNTGRESPMVNQRMAMNSPAAPKELREIVFIVLGPAGAELPLGARINLRPPTESDFTVLAPGAAVQREYSLGEFYSFDQPGQYTISAVYQNSSDPPSGRETWKGEVLSNIVIITVR